MRDRERPPESSDYDRHRSPSLSEAELSFLTFMIYHWWDQLERDWQAVICGLIFLTVVLVRVPIPW